MFNKDSFLHYHGSNSRTGFTPSNTVYEGFVQDAEGKPWGWLKSLNLYEQQSTGIRMDPAEFQRYNIDILGYGSNDGGSVSTSSYGSPYMYDPIGVASTMYSGDANILIMGDSVHNWNTSYTAATGEIPASGYYPLIGSYARKWKPAKWSGMGIPQQFGSSVVSARTNVSFGTGMIGESINPGETITVQSTLDEYRHKITSPSLYIDGVTVDNPETTYLSDSAVNSVWKLVSTQIKILPTAATVIPTGRLDSGEYYVGREQGFSAENGSTASTCWFNKYDDPIRYSHTVYRDATDGIGAIHARASTIATPLSYTFLNEHGLTFDGYNTIVLDSPSTVEDELNSSDLNSFSIQIAATGPALIPTSRMMNCWTRVYNPSIENGMEITFAGAGGWKFSNHGATQESDAPTVGGITNAWYDGEALSRMMTDFETTIVYVYITNADSVEEDRTGLRNLISRVREQYDATSLGGTIKIVVVTSHPVTGSDDAGLARRNMILEECRSLNVAYIDLYGALKDEGITESNVGGSYLVDAYHPGPTGADYFAEKIWTIIEDTATNKAY